MQWRVGAVALLLNLPGAGAMGEGPVPVSPGGAAGMALVAGRCPTFHWTAAESSESIGLVIYGVPEEESEERPQPVLSVTLPGAAHGWTPALEQCLEPGGRYAWSVRAGGDWSEASLFEVSAAPSVAEVERAMAVLRRYVAHGGEGADSHRPDRPARHPRRALEPLRSQSLGISAETTPPPRTVTSPAGYDLTVEGDVDLGGFVFKEGYPFLHNDGGVAVYNTALGLNALVSATPGVPNPSSGMRNTAVGARALRANTSGRHNTGVGEGALRYNTSGVYNTAVGLNALRNSNGDTNTAVGHYALSGNGFGTRNTAVGVSALVANSTGTENTGVGRWALSHNKTGDNNLALGHRAGRNLGYIGTPTGASTYSNNIFIGNEGAVGDAGVLKIGTQGTQTATFIAGIAGVAFTGDPVHIKTTGASTGQLGTGPPSSRRFKEDIREMGDASSGLLELRPVTFRYKREVAGDDRRRAYGLVAEEVVEVFPDLVGYTEAGEPDSVRYHLLSPLLLNELQRQHRQNRMQWLLLVAMLLAWVAMIVGRWRPA